MQVLMCNKWDSTLLAAAKQGYVTHDEDGFVLSRTSFIKSSCFKFFNVRVDTLHWHTAVFI